MSWIFFALLARFLWAASSAADQMISRSHKDAKILSGTILYFCSVLPSALISLALSENFHPDAAIIGWCVLGACASVVAILPYYKCLQTDDVHNIIPLFEFTPVFLMLLAFVINGEIMAPHQLLGAAIVILCGFVFSWDFKHGHIRLRSLSLMAISSLLYALYQFSIRSASDHMDGWGVSGILMLVETFIGFCGLLFYRRARISIITTCIETRGRSVGVAMLASCLGLLGTVAVSAAFNRAPTTGHVAALGPTMPFFSYFIAAVLGYVLAQHYQKVPFDRETQVKLLLLIGIFGGIYLLAMG